MNSNLKFQSEMKVGRAPNSKSNRGISHFNSAKLEADLSPLFSIVHVTLQCTKRKLNMHIYERNFKIHGRAYNSRTKCLKIIDHLSNVF